LSKKFVSHSPVERYCNETQLVSRFHSVLNKKMLTFSGEMDKKF